MGFEKRDERGNVEEASDVLLKRELPDPEAETEMLGLWAGACRGDMGDAMCGDTGETGAVELPCSNSDGIPREGTDTATKVSTSRARRIRSSVA